jgi:hemolysin activation/secretion protein
MRNSRLLVTTAIGLIVSASAAYAVNPGTARPEFIDNQHKIEDQQPGVSKAPIVYDEDKAGKSAVKGEGSFVLKSVQIEGATQFSAQDLKPLYADKLDKRMSVSELNALTNSITAFYRDRGFILSRAVLPPQKIESGDVKIRIVEGFVHDVRLEGDTGKGSDLLQKLADKIRASKPLNAKILERYLLLMEDLPGVTARAVLRPAANTPGASDVIIHITRKPVEASVTFDNRGSRFLGPYQASVTGTFNNALGLNEQTQLRVLNSIFQPTELQYTDLRHEEQLGSEGAKLVLAGSYSRTRPGASLDSSNIDGWSATGSVGANYPILRSRQTNWFVNGDFDVRDTDVQSQNIRLYRDKISALRVGTTYDFMDRWLAVSRMETTVSEGVNWWNGNEGSVQSRPTGQTTFTKVASTVTRIQPISGSWSLFNSVTGQYSNAPLLAAEEFALGGEEFGSAYDTAEITGDDGLATRLELQYSRPTMQTFLTHYQLYAFYDLGRVWNRSIVVGGTEPSHASLADTGVGSRFNMTQSMSGAVELAFPLTRPVAANNANGNGEDPRFFFNLQYRY